MHKSDSSGGKGDASGGKEGRLKGEAYSGPDSRIHINGEDSSGKDNGLHETMDGHQG